MSSKPKIIIVDDCQIFRQGLVSIINLEQIATVYGEASNAIEFMELLTQLNPDLVLLNIDMSGMNVINATKMALGLFPLLKIVVYSSYGNEIDFTEMITLGVKGFILKSCGINEVEKAIVQVMKGENYFPSRYVKNLSADSDRKYLKN